MRVDHAISAAQGEAHAGERNGRACASRPTAGQAANHAGWRVREEMHHSREGKHGARSTKQAIAIGLSKARRAGVKLGRAPKSAKPKTRASAAAASRAGRRGRRRKQPGRSRATMRALRCEPRAAASRPALARQARQAARRRGPKARKAAARKAVATKGPARLRAAGRKAAATRKAA